MTTPVSDSATASHPSTSMSTNASTVESDNQSQSWDHEVDVLVVGSGNGALTGAISSYDGGAKDVLVIEKSDKFGGTSALSGGGVWVPNNRYAKAAGASDSYDDALTYLKHTIPGEMVKTSMLETYLQQAPKMIDYLHAHTRVRYQSLEKYPDYFSDQPGARNGHRSMEPEPIDFSDLEEDMDHMLEGGTMYMFYRYSITQVEGQILISRVPGWIPMMAKLLWKHYSDIPWLLNGRSFSRRTTGGGAGVIRLFLSMKDRGIPLWRNTALQSLITDNEGDATNSGGKAGAARVIGAVVNKQGKTLRIKARKGVLLAAGGFEQNQQMREQYLPQPTNTYWSAGCKTNTGDAIQAGMAVGAKVALMDNAWWCTTKRLFDRPYPFLSIINKSLPGSIVVNKAGKRFSNESQNYMSFLKETFAVHSDDNPCIPMYMVFDADFRRNRNVWPAVMPDFMLKRYFDDGLVARGETVEELATNLGVDAANLKETIERFNGFVDTGKDLDFQRGDAAYDRYYGDPTFKPNPCLGKIVKPPFMAVKLDAGDFGTQGGLVTNENAQVCRADGTPVAGLYAAGNCTAAVLPTYPGPGSTLGPAMTFAYLAAKHMNGQD